ncbi:MAG TPA: ABC transporter substrate-binding protein [Chloroflexota bacterium]|nr:ABC transporter substrate-binding protein [Chloroflexota bacterium]
MFTLSRDHCAGTSAYRRSRSRGGARRGAAAVLAFLAVLGTMFTGCVSAAPQRPNVGGDTGAESRPARTKTLVYAVTDNISGFGIVVGSTSTGGWSAANELHSAALITSDVTTRKPIGRIATRVPNVEDGSISVLPDGRMRVVYTLRPDVLWHDGVPVTAQDMVFTANVESDRGLPYPQRDALLLFDSAEAPDDTTFVLNFRQPYYLGGSLGLRFFFPLPRHLLEEPFQRYQETGNAEEFINLPYWTSQFVGDGPFRLTSYDPSSEAVFEAFDRYFLGRPKIDILRVKVFSDQQTLFSNLLAGTVDLFPENVLTGELGFQLKDRWEAMGGGRVYIRPTGFRFLAPQWRPSVQLEPTTLDLPVRAALYRAIDREALAEGLFAGHRELAAFELLPPNDPYYLATKDSLRQYSYDPERAKSMLRDAGWVAGADGALRNASDGRTFHTAISATQDIIREVPAFADSWRRLGLEVEELLVPPPQVRNNEYRSSYPGWEASAQASGDGILGRLEGPAAGPQNRWTGNRGGYDDPRAQALVDRYRQSLSERDQFDAMKAVSDFVAAELPFLVQYGVATDIGVRTGVKAYDDYEGGDSAGRPYGTYNRNAHLWDLE